MLIKTKGIVLKSMKYGETSLIVEIFTEEKGLRKYIVSGVRKKNSRIGAALLQVMSQVEIVAYEREGKDLNRLKEIRAANVYQSIPLDIKKGAVGLFMAEIAQKTLRESEENLPLYQFLTDIFTFLDKHDGNVANLPLAFMLELSGFLGFMPELDDVNGASFFDLENGVFCDQPPFHSNYVEENYGAILKSMLRIHYHSCHNIPLNVEQRRYLLEKLLDYYKLHIENFPVINAHLILQEIFS